MLAHGDRRYLHHVAPVTPPFFGNQATAPTPSSFTNTHTQFPNPFDLLSTALNLGYDEQTTYPISFFSGLSSISVFFSRCLTGYTISCAAFVLFNGLLFLSCPLMTSLVFLFLFVFPISSQLSKRYLAFIHCTIPQQCTFIFGFRPSTIPPSSSFLSCIHMYALSVLPLHPVLPHPILSRTSTSPSSLFPFPQFRHAYTRKTLRYQRFWHKIILNHNPNLLFVHVLYSH